MKKFLLVILALTCLLSLAGCGCEHQWADAACEAPRTCAKCGKTEGAPNGHSWLAAACNTPKTCEICGKTEGDALGHDWKAATCEEGAKCLRCGFGGGEALGHNWLDATTDAPQTCAVCGKTQGERIITDSRFTTAACQSLFGTWEGVCTMTGEMMGDATLPDMEIVLAITFHNDGTFTEDARMADKEGYAMLLTDYYINALYAEFANQYGMSEAEADQAMLEAYGMDVRTYSEALAAIFDWDALLSAACQEGVYYVSGNQLYSGLSWNALEAEPLRLSGGTLVLLSPMDGVSDFTVTKVE